MQREGISINRTQWKSIQTYWIKSWPTIGLIGTHWCRSFSNTSKTKPSGSSCESFSSALKLLTPEQGFGQMHWTHLLNESCSYVYLAFHGVFGVCNEGNSMFCRIEIPTLSINLCAENGYTKCEIVNVYTTLACEPFYIRTWLGFWTGCSTREPRK